MKMNIFDRFPAGGLAVACILAMLGLSETARGQVAFARAATVLRLEGKARYSIDNQTWQPLKEGTVFNLGAIVQTAEKARIDILLDDPAAEAKSGGQPGGDTAGDNQAANVVRVLPNTVLAIDKLTAVRYDSLEEVQLDLRSGQILASARKLTGKARYEVKVANGVVGVRSGFFKISSNGLVDVSTGSVMAAETIGDGTLVTKLVSAGKRFDPATGTITDAPPIDAKERSEIKENRSSGANNSATPPAQRVPGIGGGFRKY